MRCGYVSLAACACLSAMASDQTVTDAMSTGRSAVATPQFQPHARLSTMPFTRVPRLLARLRTAVAAAALAPLTLWAASSTSVSVEDGQRSHSGSNGVVFRVGAGVAGGQTGVHASRSESWIESAYGSAYARANLATASMHAATSSTPTWLPPSIEGSTAAAAMSDRLYFDVLGADANTVTAIEVIWRQTGSISAQLNTGWAATMSLQGKGGGLSLERRVRFDSTPGKSLLDQDKLQIIAPDMSRITFDSLPWTVTGDVNGEFVARGWVHMVGARPDFLMQAAFTTFSTLGASTDFAASVHLSFNLPSNVTMTSASGTFMTAVPEPDTAVLFGLGALGLLLCRRKAA